jgi:hypothetical protein
MRSDPSSERLLRGWARRWLRASGLRRLICLVAVIGMAGYASASPASGPPASAGQAAGELVAGERFPELRGEYLSGRKAALPGDASGRVALLALGFTYPSRLPVAAWTKRFRGEFDNTAQVTFYQIPILGGTARMGKWFIESGMRRGTPKADRENVITVYADTETWKQRLGVRAEDSAYLVLLDRRGNVVWRHAGPFEETQYQTLAAQVRKLLSGP